MASSLFSLNFKDAGKGLLVAFITAFLAGITAAINTGALPTLDQIKVSAIAGVTAGVAYLIKNFFTNSTGTVAATEVKQ